MTLVSRDLLIIEQQGVDAAAAAFPPTDVQHSQCKIQKKGKKRKGGGGTDTNKPECNASTRHIVFEQDAQS